jgi:Ca2+-binding EF-hand superfamily protein
MRRNALACIVTAGLVAGIADAAPQNAQPEQAETNAQNTRPEFKPSENIAFEGENRRFLQDERLMRFDADNDGELSPQERAQARKAFKAQRQQIFSMLDTDQDGVLSEAEWSTFSSSIGETEMSQFFRRRAVFERFDENDNGKLEKPERAKALRELHERRIDFVARFDENADGKLDNMEKKQAVAFVNERRQALLAQYDANDDGTLDEQERNSASVASVEDDG